MNKILFGLHTVSLLLGCGQLEKNKPVVNKDSSFNKSGSINNSKDISVSHSNI